MFLIKSTFWLGVALVVIQPQNLDLGAKTASLGSAAINAGQQALIQQLTAARCETIQCSGGKALTLASTFITDATKTNEVNGIEEQILPPQPMPRLKRRG